MNPITTVGSECSKSADLRTQFDAVRSMTMRITAPLSAEDQMLQSMPDASPAKWHLAHTTWFFETFILEPHLRGYKAQDPRFTYLFNSYYKQLGGHPYRGARGLMSRPTLEEVYAYRRHVDRAIPEALENASQEVLDLLEIGINHEQQHQELILTDSKHGLWSSPLRPEQVKDAGDETATARLTWTEIDGGIYEVGHAGTGFAFDNESPRHEVLLRPYKIASRLVTNGEFMEFIEDSGYRRPQLWLSDGWDLVSREAWQAPLYWERDGEGTWRQFDGAGMKKVRSSEPVCHLSYFEAEAFARWSEARLPTEEEWEIAAVRMPSRGTLLDDEVFHPQAARGEGHQQMFGDVWEWTASAYLPYPGYQPAAGAVGEYNGKFMCNQFVLRGGSCATPASHIRSTYRNFFPPQARWQFSGLRLAK